MTEPQRQLALEEWKLCQAVIAQLESTIYRRQGWLFALVTALLVATLKTEPLLGYLDLVAVTLGLVMVFSVAEIIQRLPHHRAIQRSREIEACLRGDEAYEGPVLSVRLGQSQSGRDWSGFIHRPRFWMPYLAILLVVAMAGQLGPSAEAPLSAEQADAPPTASPVSTVHELSVHDLDWQPWLDQAIRQLEEVLAEATQQQQMNYTAANLGFVYDAKLYILFGQYLRSLPPSERPAALAEQKLWFEYLVQADDDARQPFQGGTGAPLAGNIASIKATKARIAELTARLEPAP